MWEEPPVGSVITFGGEFWVRAKVGWMLVEQDTPITWSDLIKDVDKDIILFVSVSDKLNNTETVDKMPLIYNN